MRIVLDTNFLLIPFQYNIDIFTLIDDLIHVNYELCVTEGTLKELEKIATEQRGKDSKAASLGLQFIKSKSLKIIPQILNSVDDALVELSDKDTIIATQDAELRERIIKKGSNIIMLRGNHLEMI